MTKNKKKASRDSTSTFKSASASEMSNASDKVDITNGKTSTWVDSLTLVEKEAPIISHFNHQVRPLLDVIDRLRALNVMKEGIQLPTIVVVGDQSSGKSSVLESLAGISLPRSVGICTRVPLVMRLQSHKSPTPEIYLEYGEKTVEIDEADITTAITNATDEIAGTSKGISNTPLTLVVKKEGIPDLTMVDLPGITRVPVHGQPANIYEQIRSIIMKYITPEESIILNVLSATVDFSTCESIQLSQTVDLTGERTLAVVTKGDRGPQELSEKVNGDDVNIGLGYVCVRNRIGEESFEEARREEALLFETDPHLMGIDKSIVGIPVLAQKLVEIQERIIAKCLPGIMKNITSKLNENIGALEKMPKVLFSFTDALTAFMRIIGASKETLRKLLLQGEFDEYRKDPSMHGTARLVDMLNQFSSDLHKAGEENEGEFLSEEIEVLEDGKGIGLPNFLPRAAFLRILQRKVDRISDLPVKFAEKFWDYMEQVVTTVLMRHSDTYYQLKASTKRAGHNVIQNMRESSIKRVVEIVEMEELTDYTSNPDYLNEWNKLMTRQEDFLATVTGEDKEGSTSSKDDDWLRDIDFEHLEDLNKALLQQAFDLNMRMKAYWKIVLTRLVDSMALHLQHCVHRFLKNDIENIVNEVMEPDGKGIERMLVESPAISGKRDRLKRSIKLLTESKEIISNIIVRIAD